MLNKFISVFPALLLTACASPSMQYAGVEGIPVDVDGSRFIVYRQHNEVQAIRTSREILPDEAEMRAKAAAAIEQATKCSISKNSLSGDEIVADAKIIC